MDLYIIIYQGQMELAMLWGTDQGMVQMSFPFQWQKIDENHIKLSILSSSVDIWIIFAP